MKAYDHKKIEKKWQTFWSKNKIYTTPDTKPGKDNFFLLVEFPYPSGNLHVGHWYAFAVPDILARYHRMTGKNVLYPIGFDAFGLPAENAAIKNKLNPRDWTEKNIAHMTKQIESMGTSFDWSRKVSTIDPKYYKWTQWLFLELYKKGLVYQKETAVNWCPKDKTVLANEQVVSGKCERCGTEVIQKLMLQWNVKITDYADRLVDDLDPLDWPEQIKDSQRNWIGRSEGAEVDFQLKFDGDDTKYNFVMLHGKHASSHDDFWPWLREQLERRGYKVQVPDLPNSENPDDEEQATYVQKNCNFDDKTILVGHSFGGVVAMRLLERGLRVHGLTFISTPTTGEYLDGKKRETVTKAVKKGFDWKTIKQNAKRILALYDTNDHVVAISDGELLSQKLEAPLFKVGAEKSHFNATIEPEVLKYCDPTISVFTTRPDTLFGATYLVLAPEHPWVTLALEHKSVLKNNDEVAAYVKAASKKTELERQQDTKEKTGVRLDGVMAVNPATGEKIPLYVADYVLGHYGTGAIMAVPAHDERDYEFAKKFDIPIRQVVQPLFGKDNKRNEAVHRETVTAVVKNAKGEVLLLRWPEYKWLTAVIGGIESGETPEAAAEREVLEETGYHAKALAVSPITTHSYFYADHKKEWRSRHDTVVLLELQGDTPDPIAPDEASRHHVEWTKVDQALNSEMYGNNKIAIELALGRLSAYTAPRFGEDQILVNSGEFNGMNVADAKKALTERFGRGKKTYRLRDWIVSRQRYWGVPIPIVHCAECGAQPVPTKDLPVELPAVEDYLPDGNGKSPLAKVKDFVEVKCPKCGGKAQRETDTLDTFVDSSWYYLRYVDPKNNKAFASKAKLAKWMPVDLYSGGAEHTTMHVLYSRFWQKALYDMDLVADPEPYTRRMNRSIILGPDGQKMSKSHGNVIDPDEVVERLGADTVRMYLAFVGPYSEVSSFPWNPDGVVGVRRFLERAWRLQEKTGKEGDIAPIFHKTIKKVGEDILAMKFNTAISQMMILLNELEKAPAISKDEWEVFLRLLAPFAPHMADELWSELGHKKSVHVEPWPKYDESKLVDDEVTYGIQIDGKTRGEVKLPTTADKAAAEAAAREVMTERLKDREVVRVIVVPGRLVSFVTKEK